MFYCACLIKPEVDGGHSFLQCQDSKTLKRLPSPQNMILLFLMVGLFVVVVCLASQSKYNFVLYCHFKKLA